MSSNAFPPRKQKKGGFIESAEDANDAAVGMPPSSAVSVVKNSFADVFKTIFLTEMFCFCYIFVFVVEAARSKLRRSRLAFGKRCLAG